MKIAFIIGYGSPMLRILREILAAESRKFDFDYLAISSSNLHHHLDDVAECDVLFLYTPQLLKEEEAAIENSRAKIVISASDTYAHLSKGQEEVIRKAILYFKLGGEENLRNLVRFLLKCAGFENYEAKEIGEPRDIPWHAVFHPELGVFRSTQEYLKSYPFSDRPLVGILIHRNYWLYDNLEHLKALVKAVEDEGLGVIPVFTYGWRDEMLRTPSKEDTIREFFMADGKAVVDAVISLTYFFLLDHSKSDERGIELLKSLQVPVFQPCFSSSQSIEDWKENLQGIDYFSQVYTVVMPEVDGLIEPIYLAGCKVDDESKSFEVYKAHAKLIARRVKKWVELRRKKPEDRKIAIILINPPCKGLEASVAVGFGLDVPESVVRLLKKLKEEGYRIDGIPESGKDLMNLILERKAVSEFRWTSVDEIVRRGGAVGFVDYATYMEWFRELDEKAKKEMVRVWGLPEKVLGHDGESFAGMVYNGRFVIPGLIFGNVAIIPQPKFGCAGSRCDGEVCKILHDPTTPLPHQWLAVYRWITRIFRADVIIHFGTHGYLEFRPGKGVGLSTSCWPEISVDDVPHLYVYNVSNPMEGVIAKRRSFATIVDHLYPPMMMAEIFDELESLLTQYSRAKNLGDFERAEIVYREIVEKAREGNIRIKAENPDEVVEEIHRQVEAVKNTQIEKGLHIFAFPNEEKLADYIAAIMAHDTAEFSSLRRAIAEYLGLDYDGMRAKPLELNKFSLTNSETLGYLHKIAVKTVDDLISADDVDGVDDNTIIEILSKNISEVFDGIAVAANDKVNDKVILTFKKAIELAEKIRECRKEYDGFVSGISGNFVEPGSSGSLTRGKIEILPTGRNFFAVDPTSLPTRAAWKIGVETAKKLIKYYYEKHGRYPESIGEWLWSVDAYKADGEQIAQILYLLGVRPVWTNGAVKGLEVIPLEELSRPRIDVVVRISGITRDTLPNYINLIDEAVTLVATLNEPVEMNYVRKHYLQHVSKLGELALCRVFSSPPGTYGTGVNYAVEASAWRDDEDLAKTWVRWSGYAYTRKYFGKEAFESLVTNLKHVDVVARNHSTDEHDIFNCCCYFSYHGGFYNTVKSLGKEAEIVTVDTREVTRTEIREMKDEIERIVRAKLLNRIWIGEMKKHGYRGANEFLKKILHLYGWSATTKLVDKWVFDEIAKTYILDEEMRRWFEENNVYAAEEIARRLVEAYERGLWKADGNMIESLKEAYAEIEGILEDDLSDAGEVQGGVIEIYTMNEVEGWKKSSEKVVNVWEKLKG